MLITVVGQISMQANFDLLATAHGAGCIAQAICVHSMSNSLQGLAMQLLCATMCASVSMRAHVCVCVFGAGVLCSQPTLSRLVYIVHVRWAIISTPTRLVAHTHVSR